MKSLKHGFIIPWPRIAEQLNENDFEYDFIFDRASKAFLNLCQKVL